MPPPSAPPPPGSALRVGVSAGLQMALLGGVLWVTGLPVVFPSLGPTAFVLATRPATARDVLGGHAWGVAAGLLAYHVLAPGLTVTGLAPLSVDGLRLAASATAAVAATVWAMVRTQTVHGPACATTLIVALGVLPHVWQGGVILAAVALMYAGHAALGSLLGPLSGSRP